MSSDSRDRLTKKLNKLRSVIDAIEHNRTRDELEMLRYKMQTLVNDLPMTWDEESNSPQLEQ